MQRENREAKSEPSPVQVSRRIKLKPLREKQENKEKKEASKEDDTAECVVCLTDTSNTVLLPCRHSCVCRTCFQQLAQCPMCRSQINAHLYLQPQGTPESDTAIAISNSEEGIELTSVGDGRG